MTGKGFASLSIEERKRIASMGGKRAQELGTGHRFTTEEASIWGKKGGKSGTGAAKIRVIKNMNHLERMQRRLDIHRGIIKIDNLEILRSRTWKHKEPSEYQRVPLCICTSGLQNLECPYREDLLITLER